ncbi:PAS domain-containing protein [Meridianimarinicoccus aquatilis]|uniref:PAS domain-containing protein n=1 Tax=Meridianimarinicoccus aquatilis TaxID=2552766 RepID=A0A4R6ALX9_9RHOB|nr:PAS domain-containing protein [Fluviibacterium aquatile]TDL85331.1 PAS domain-containing protein [Fluviibacterium aquatile]
MAKPYVAPGEPDAKVVAGLAQDLAQGRSDTVGKYFAAHGASAPQIVWTPSLEDPRHPVLRSFLRACGETDSVLPVTWLDSDAFSVLRDWAMIVEPGETEGDYIYRYYGSKIAEVYQFDMTGRSVSEFGGYISGFFAALYKAVELRRQPVMSAHEPPKQVFVRAWRRIIQPLVDEGGNFACFAVINIPDNELRAGLDVLPDAVMVVSADGNVCFANRAACVLFGQARSPLGSVSLQEFAGLELALPDAPEKLILEGRPRHLRRLTARGKLLLPVALTIAATYYRDQPFFIISARRDEA